jgi:hypothetical protein
LAWYAGPLGGSRRSRAISNNRDLSISAIAPQSRGDAELLRESDDCGGINL